MDEFKNIVENLTNTAVEDVTEYFNELTNNFKGSDTLRHLPKEADKIFEELGKIKRKKDKNKHLVTETVKLAANVVEDLFKEELKKKEANKSLKLYDIEDFVRKSSKRITNDRISLKFNREHEFVYLRRDGINGYYLARVRWKTTKNRPMNIKLGPVIHLNAKSDKMIHITVPGRFALTLLSDSGVVLGYEVLEPLDGESSEQLAD